MKSTEKYLKDPEGKTYKLIREQKNGTLLVLLEGPEERYFVVEPNSLTLVEVE